eukprot:CAMPEP_0181303600 /NCGR_PEP_ID=MMETSP1101-20121128/8652_1 /TAXON_ID=46948 /ORGANISM="Rhodomonas abbreviata, Strain Caron Lab Isolate" /LENGTH=839 /DNA_ID=CAMNT_0023409199 /DNA_START=77 /DNA_END=2596 /DNA_ORIENTATION=-
MVNFTMQQLRALMDKTENIRNMSVVAHVDHGKTALTDSLLAASGIISMATAGEQCAMSSRPDEAKRGITIKSTGVSLYYDILREDLPDDRMPRGAEGREFLVNLIDSPGHVDFSAEVTAALRITDGALVVVDCIEGVCVQTETVLRQALADRIKPIVTINKLDRGFLEVKLEPEAMYQSFKRHIDQINVIVSTFHEGGMPGDLLVSPNNGTVGFSAGLHGWAFTVPQFAQMYAKKFGVSEEKMCEKLWGEHYFGPDKKWAVTGEPEDRAFNKLILEPVSRVVQAAMSNQLDKLTAMLDKLNVQLTKEELAMTGKDLVKRCMQRWLPAHKALLEMIIIHLPSPAAAQKYRAGALYTGPVDDHCCSGIRLCDPHGPLVLYVSKMVPGADKGRFVAFGRVFSGTVSPGQKVRVMGPNFVPGSKDDLAIKSIQRVVLFMGKKQEAVDSVPAGNTCGIVGIDQFLVKTGTLSTSEDCCPLKNLSFSVSPVVRCAVQPKNPLDLPKLVEGLKRLAKSDPMVVVSVEESGEHIVAGAGELHMEICLKDLEELYMNGAPIKVSDPIVNYRETVSGESFEPCLAKSNNKHNRIWTSAFPLGAELTDAIELGDVSAVTDNLARARKLAETYGWEADIARKVWAFGPDFSGPNVLRDGTHGVQNLMDGKQNIVSAFQWVSNEGVLTEESMRGIGFTILDVVLHQDALHRGAGKVIPAARRSLLGAQYTAAPRLMEPIFVVEVSCPETCLGTVYSWLHQRRGQVTDEVQRPGTPMFTVKGLLPVAESFGFDRIRGATSGQAQPQMVFSHWDVVPGDPMEAGSACHKIVTDVRTRKGLAPELPPLDRYKDRL